MYEFILDLLNMVEANKKTLFVLSTHHITMSTLLCLEFIAKKLGKIGSLFYAPFGKMYKDENRATEEMIGGWENFYNFYSSRHYAFDLEIATLDQVRCAIQSELDLYLALKTQTLHLS